jgi:hypothetical protein
MTLDSSRCHTKKSKRQDSKNHFSKLDLDKRMKKKTTNTPKTPLLQSSDYPKIDFCSHKKQICPSSQSIATNSIKEEMSANKKNKRQQSEDAPVEEADTTNYPGANKEVVQFIVRFVT